MSENKEMKKEELKCEDLLEKYRKKSTGKVVIPLSDAQLAVYESEGEVDNWVDSEEWYSYKKGRKSK